MSELNFPPTSLKAVGTRLRLTRIALGFDAQGKFAKAAGIAGNTYNQYEKGNRTPDLQQAIRLCDRFTLTLDWIYRGDPSGLNYKLAEDIKKVRAASKTNS